MPIYLGNTIIEKELVGTSQLGNIFLGNQLLQASPTNIIAEGGAISFSGSYIIHTFTSSGDFRVTQGNPNVEYLIVGGGGAGANGTTILGCTSTVGGAGGAGGVLYTSSFALTKGLFPIIVGTGSSTANVSGSNSTFAGFTAFGGGGGGGGIIFAGQNGGSGGGAGGTNSSQSGGTGTAGQGNNGADNSGALSCPPYTVRNASGGGGGASSAGSGTTGGSPISYSISGVAVNYGAGGNAAGTIVAKTANTGNGGDGGNQGSPSFGSGASGIVIIKYNQYP